MSEEIVRRAPELDPLARVGSWLAAAETSNPSDIQRGASAALRLWVAKELGLSPLMGLKIGVTPRGEIILPASMYRDLAAQRGYLVKRVDSTDTSCTAVLIREATGEEVDRLTFTIEDAARAGLIKQGGAYEKYPQRMLWQRASKWLVEDYVPGLGFALSEEEVEAENGTIEAEHEELPADPPKPEPDPEGSSAPPDSPPDPSSDEASTVPELITEKQRKRMMALFTEKGIDERVDRLDYCARVIGRAVPTSTELTSAEAEEVNEHLASYDIDDPSTWPIPHEPGADDIPFV